MALMTHTQGFESKWTLFVSKRPPDLAEPRAYGKADAKFHGGRLVSGKCCRTTWQQVKRARKCVSAKRVKQNAL